MPVFVTVLVTVHRAVFVTVLVTVHRAVFVTVFVTVHRAVLVTVFVTVHRAVFVTVHRAVLVAVLLAMLVAVLVRGARAACRSPPYGCFSTASLLLHAFETDYSRIPLVLPHTMSCSESPEGSPQSLCARARPTISSRKTALVLGWHFGKVRQYRPQRSLSGSSWVKRAGALLLLSGWVNAASAGSCPTPPEASPLVADESAEARLDFLESRLPRARNKAKAWFWAWTGSFIALTPAQLALIPLYDSPKDTRMLVVNAGATAAGALFLVLAPPPMMRLEKRVAKMTEGNASSCARLHALEGQLADAARVESFGASWWMHAGNLAFNVAAGLILGLGWGEWENAFLTTALGTLVGETMIWTQPMDVNRLLTEYRRGTWTAGSSSRAGYPTEFGVMPLAVPQGGGLAVAVRF